MITSKILITTSPKFPKSHLQKPKENQSEKASQQYQYTKGLKQCVLNWYTKGSRPHVPDPYLPISQSPLSRKINQDNFKSVSHLKSLQVPVPRAYGMVKWIQSLLQESKNHKNFTPEKKEIHKNKSKRNPKTQDPR